MIFTSQIGPDCIRGPKSQKFPGGACPQTPPKWCAVTRYSIAPSNFLYVAFYPPLVIFSKRNPDSRSKASLYILYSLNNKDKKFTVNSLNKKDR